MHVPQLVYAQGLARCDARGQRGLPFACERENEQPGRRRSHQWNFTHRIDSPPLSHSEHHDLRPTSVPGKNNRIKWLSSGIHEAAHRWSRYPTADAKTTSPHVERRTRDAEVSGVLRHAHPAGLLAHQRRRIPLHATPKRPPMEGDEANCSMGRRALANRLLHLPTGIQGVTATTLPSLSMYAMHILCHHALAAVRLILQAMKSPLATEPSTEDASFKVALGRRMRDARKRLAMKQEAAARALGVAVATLSRWEQGHFTPGAQHLSRIAVLLQVTMDWLCGVQVAAPSLLPGTAIVDQDAYEALAKAAASRANVESLNGLVKPPTIAVASLVPNNMRLVPPAEVSALHQSIRQLVDRLT